jgi:hypothetical protein
MTEQKEIIRPDVVADIFIEKFKLYMSGELREPVFSDELSATFLTCIKETPLEMITFFIQVSYFIKLKVDEEEGENSEMTVLALTQFQSVMFSWIIRPLSACMRANVEMAGIIGGTLDPISDFLKTTIQTPLGIPEGNPQDIFGAIEGLDFPNWIGQEVVDLDEPDSSEDGTDPEQDL